MQKARGYAIIAFKWYLLSIAQKKLLKGYLVVVESWLRNLKKRNGS